MSVTDERCTDHLCQAGIMQCGKCESESRAMGVDKVPADVVPDSTTGAGSDPVDTYSPGEDTDAPGDAVHADEAVYDEAALVKAFDHTEARWQDEKAHEDFSEYREFMKRMCTLNGVTMLSLEAEPFVLQYKHLNTVREMRINDEGRIEVNVVISKE